MVLPRTPQRHEANIYRYKLVVSGSWHLVTGAFFPTSVPPSSSLIKERAARIGPRPDFSFDYLLPDSHPDPGPPIPDLQINIIDV